MRRGFLYLVAIMDWASRKVLAWRLSNTMEADFCVAALEEAIARHGRPDIFNTRSGQPVHQLRLYQHAQGRRHSHLHGRPWPLDGQRLHRAEIMRDSRTAVRTPKPSQTSAFGDGQKSRCELGATGLLLTGLLQTLERAATPHLDGSPLAAFVEAGHG